VSIFVFLEIFFDFGERSNFLPFLSFWFLSFFDGTTAFFIGILSFFYGSAFLDLSYDFPLVTGGFFTSFLSILESFLSIF